MSGFSLLDTDDKTERELWRTRCFGTKHTEPSRKDLICVPPNKWKKDGEGVLYMDDKKIERENMYSTIIGRESWSITGNREEDTRTINDLLDLLFLICEEHERSSVVDMPEEVQEWWDQNKKWMQEEIANKNFALRQNALAKLTTAERKALGV